MLHPVPGNSVWLPYLGETLDSGTATLLATETIEAIRFVRGQQPERLPGLRLTGTSFTSPDAGNGTARGVVLPTALSTISSSAPGVSNWSMVVCPGSPLSSGRPKATKPLCRSSASCKSATFWYFSPAMSTDAASSTS